jgi:hypothetical protein
MKAIFSIEMILLSILVCAASSLYFLREINMELKSIKIELGESNKIQKQNILLNVKDKENDDQHR